MSEDYISGSNNPATCSTVREILSPLNTTGLAAKLTKTDPFILTPFSQSRDTCSKILGELENHGLVAQGTSIPEKNGSFRISINLSAMSATEAKQLVQTVVNQALGRTPDATVGGTQTATPAAQEQGQGLGNS